MDKWNRIWFLVFLLNVAVLPLVFGQTTPEAPATPPPATNPPAALSLATSTNAVTNASDAAVRINDEALRSYLHLQEQLHAARLAIEQARLAASDEAQTNLGAMMARMEALEAQLADQRAAQAQSAHQSNRILTLAAAGIFVVGILAIILTVVLQARGMNRLAEIATGMSAARGLAAMPEPLSLGTGDRLLLGAGEGRESLRLQSTISRLEERIREIEITAENSPENGDLAGGTRSAVLARVQALLNQGEDEAALVALEEAIPRHPSDATLHAKRGLALERLKRFQAAVESYERAIALDSSCTQAYLGKGGILNQQERYQEALACYEQALAQGNHLSPPGKR